jgi:hypothetical protein
MPAIRYCEEHRYAKNTETFIERPSTSSSKPAVRMEQHNGERRQASKTLSRKAARCGNGRKFRSNINSSQGQPLTAERHRCVDPSNFAQQIEWTGKTTDFKSTDVAPTQ